MLRREEGERERDRVGKGGGVEGELHVLTLSGMYRCRPSCVSS